MKRTTPSRAKAWLGAFLFCVLATPLVSASCVIERVIESDSHPDSSASEARVPEVKMPDLPTPVFAIGGKTVDIDALIASAISQQQSTGNVAFASGRNFGGMTATNNCSISSGGTGIKVVTITDGFVSDDKTIPLVSIVTQNGESAPAKPTITVEKADTGSQYSVYTRSDGVLTDMDFTIVFYKLP